MPACELAVISQSAETGAVLTRGMCHCTGRRQRKTASGRNRVVHTHRMPSLALPPNDMIDRLCTNPTTGLKQYIQPKIIAEVNQCLNQ